MHGIGADIEAKRKSAERVADALRLSPIDAGLRGTLHADFSNAPIALEPTRGGPLGGLLAALSLQAARQNLNIDAPLQSLSVQFLAVPRFKIMGWQPRLLRGGRALSYVSIVGVQGPRQFVQAQAVFAKDGAGPSMNPTLPLPLAPPEALQELQGDPTIFPWFHRHVEYRFERGSRLFGENIGRSPTLRVWMRIRGGEPLHEARLCMLLDAIYPTFWTILPPPPRVAVTVHLNYEIVSAIVPEMAPDGWIFVEFRTQGLGGGWAIEDASAFTRSGTPIAMARQRRKLLAGH